MNLNDALWAGFSRANHRIGDVILDVLWKGIWLAITGGLMFGFLAWFYSELQSITVNGPPDVLRNPLALAVLTRQLWAAYASTFFWFALGLVSMSALSWILLESYFRAGLVPGSAEPFLRSASHHFTTFLASAVLKFVIVSSAIVTLGLIVFERYLSTPLAEWRNLWPESRLSFVVVIVICAVLWFALTIVETLMRVDALDLMATHLFLTVGLIATLFVFEAMIVVSVILGQSLLMTTLSGAVGQLVIVVTGLISLAALIALHSYLLVVRFSSVTALNIPVAAVYDRRQFSNL